MQAETLPSAQPSRASFSKAPVTVWIHPGYANALLLEYKELFGQGIKEQGFLIAPS